MSTLYVTVLCLTEAAGRDAVVFRLQEDPWGVKATVDLDMNTSRRRFPQKQIGPYIYQCLPSLSFPCVLKKQLVLMQRRFGSRNTPGEEATAGPGHENLPQGDPPHTARALHLPVSTLSVIVLCLTEAAGSDAVV